MREINKITLLLKFIYKLLHLIEIYYTAKCKINKEKIQNLQDSL